MTDMTERAFYQDLDSDAAADWTPVASDLSDVDRALDDGGSSDQDAPLPPASPISDGAGRTAAASSPNGS
jgi:hypothetical protein